MKPDAIVAVFGGSFNPPHVAHVLAVAYVLAVHEVDRVLVVPTFQHPFAKALAPYEDRLRMCALGMGFLPKVEISSIERDLGGESRTLRTVEHLHAANPGWKMRLVIGADVLLESKKWYAFDAVAALAPPLVLGRAGVLASAGDELRAPDPLLPAVSSTEVRAKLAARAYDDVAPLLPRDVLAYVKEKGLYT